jgi:transposase InsO family protein
MARQLDVARSGYYAWIERLKNPGKRAKENAELTAKIKIIFQDQKNYYGSPRVHAELRANGHHVGRNRVARLMADNGLKAKCRRRFRRCQRRGIQAAAPNLLARQFHPIHPDLSWAGDITYIRTTAGWRYLAVWIDLYSRRVVGWKIGASMEANLVIEALDRALEARSVKLEKLMIHTDQGSQYTGKDFQQKLVDKEITCSMSRRGNCWDNACVESFFATLKDELEVALGLLRTPEELLRDLAFWIDGYYNPERRHSSISYYSPIAFEQRTQITAKVTPMAA